MTCPNCGYSQYSCRCTRETIEEESRRDPFMRGSPFRESEVDDFVRARDRETERRRSEEEEERRREERREEERAQERREDERRLEEEREQFERQQEERRREEWDDDDPGSPGNIGGAQS